METRGGLAAAPIRVQVHLCSSSKPNLCHLSDPVLRMDQLAYFDVVNLVALPRLSKLGYVELLA